MSFKTNLFDFEVRYFPAPSENMPFGEILNTLFFRPIDDNQDFLLHGPNCVRFTEALLSGEPTREHGLLKGDELAAKDVFMSFYPRIMEALEVKLGKNSSVPREKVVDLLRVAALFHDIGKFIRRANHPAIGANLLRNFDENQRQRLVEALTYQTDSVDSDAKHNRFSLIASIVQHHDKFGVVSTGEGALPLFSDILYFTSDSSTIAGIRKNVTSVMVLNLVDIAAVNTASKDVRERAADLAKSITDSRKVITQSKKLHVTKALNEISNLCKLPGSSLGLDADKLAKVLEDWDILIEVIDHEQVQGNRVKLKHHLLELERNPSRAIKRILRLLQESARTTNCQFLTDGKYMSPTSVESVLVGTLGAYQFQTFCELLSTVAKLDYGLNFFKAILCASARKAIDVSYRCETMEQKAKPWNKLTDEEAKTVIVLPEESKANLAGKITALFVRVLEGLLNRYIGVLGCSTAEPRRFGFQMRDLTLDDEIRNNIINLLCIDDHKDSIALTWIADEVTIWSMD
jgi:hypothetical protein